VTLTWLISAAAAAVVLVHNDQVISPVSCTGELLSVVIERSPPAVGLVTLTCLISTAAAAAAAVVLVHNEQDISPVSCTGELLSVVIERSPPAVGLVTLTWLISAVSGRPPSQRFDHVTGFVLFQQVCYHHIDQFNCI